MATYAIVHGAGDVGASWDLVADRLRARGHRVVAPDLPCEDESATFGDYAAVVAEAVREVWACGGDDGAAQPAATGRRGALRKITPENSASSGSCVGERDGAPGERAAARDGTSKAGAAGERLAARPARDQLVVVAHSLGGFTAPLVCELLPVDLLVFVTATVPAPGESAGVWWGATGHDAAYATAQAAGGWGDDDISLFLHDVPEQLARQALALGRDQAAAPMAEPFPLPALPDVPTRFVLCREDRFFPAEWMRGVVRERLGIEPDEIDAAHAPYLSRPGQLAARLDAYRAALATPPPLV